MAQYNTRNHRRGVFEYLFHGNFGGSFETFSERTGYTKTQAKSWLSGVTSPRKPTLDYIMGVLFVPEFQIVCEFNELDPNEPTKSQLRKSMSGHADKPGVYTFYDARAQLLYLGKATQLLEETYHALTQRADVVTFPAGIKNRSVFRSDLVAYYSAYSIPDTSFLDYPKHVESLMLRISKPPLNKQIGRLEKVKRPVD